MPFLTPRPQSAIDYLTKAMQVVRDMFGPKLVEQMKLESSEVHFHDICLAVVEGQAQNLCKQLLK